VAVLEKVMTDIQTELEQLYAEADKLMEETEQNRAPSFKVIEEAVKKLSTYRYHAELTLDVYEGKKRHYIYLYFFGNECIINVNDCSWRTLGSHDQLVLIHALPTLVRKFIENVRHNNFVAVDTLRFKKPWKFR
jgi:hypothetical protein